MVPGKASLEGSCGGVTWGAVAPWSLSGAERPPPLPHTHCFPEGQSALILSLLVCPRCVRLQKKMFCRNILQKWLTLAGLCGLGARLCPTCVHSRPRPRGSGPPRPPCHHRGRRLGGLSSEPAWHVPRPSPGPQGGAFVLSTGGRGQPGGESGAAASAASRTERERTSWRGRCGRSEEPSALRGRRKVPATSHFLLPADAGPQTLSSLELDWTLAPPGHTPHHTWRHETTGTSQGPVGQEERLGRDRAPGPGGAGGLRLGRKPRGGLRKPYGARALGRGRVPGVCASPL